MAKTKKRILDDVDTEEQEVIVPHIIQVLDEQTSIDALDKKSKEQLPKGYTKRLPAGKVRQVVVNKAEIGKKDGEVYEVYGEDGRFNTDKVVIEGACELVHNVWKGCRGEEIGSVYIETDASILIGKTKK